MPPRAIPLTSLETRPIDVLAAWPDDLPALALLSVRSHNQWARWSILATPRGVLRCGTKTEWVGNAADAPVLTNFTHDPHTDLANALAQTLDETPDAPHLPFHGGWIGYFSYDLGRRYEPTAQAVSNHSAVDDRDWPDLELAWCPDALVYDHAHHQWWSIGDPPPLNVTSSRQPVHVGELRPDVRPDDQLDAIARTIDYIAAGDIFQANITQRHTARFEGSARRIALAALQQAGAWYGTHLEFPGARTVTSLSPELFLHVDGPTRRVVTRPIKGTRPADENAEHLRDSVKDTAELHMIIDLMRNDLGRVCTIGSVQVTDPRSIETHPTVHHGVGEVAGHLRDDVSLADLIAATFPPGSVTGAPKIRAMQIIDELEPTRRGPYCGALGFISRCGTMTLNVAIRTLLMTPDGDGNRLDYSAGGGIVADSTPLAELRESLDKVEVLRLALRDLARQNDVTPIDEPAALHSSDDAD